VQYAYSTGCTGQAHTACVRVLLRAPRCTLRWGGQGTGQGQALACLLPGVGLCGARLQAGGRGGSPARARIDRGVMRVPGRVRRIARWDLPQPRFVGTTQNTAPPAQTTQPNAVFKQ